jgi:hypothetical protein
MANPAPIADDHRKRDEAAWGVTGGGGGNAGVSRLASQDFADQQGPGDERASKAASTRHVSVFAGGGWWGPTANGWR